MTAAQFRTWRKRLYRTQRAAADALGLSVQCVGNYERGREGQPVVIPKPVRLAMAALSLGIEDHPLEGKD